VRVFESKSGEWVRGSEETFVGDFDSVEDVALARKFRYLHRVSLNEARAPTRRRGGKKEGGKGKGPRADEEVLTFKVQIAFEGGCISSPRRFCAREAVQ
jgi:hypothetical protein